MRIPIAVHPCWYELYVIVVGCMYCLPGVPMNTRKNHVLVGSCWLVRSVSNWNDSASFKTITRLLDSVCEGCLHIRVFQKNMSLFHVTHWLSVHDCHHFRHVQTGNRVLFIVYKYLYNAHAYIWEHFSNIQKSSARFRFNPVQSDRLTERLLCSSLI